MDDVAAAGQGPTAPTDRATAAPAPDPFGASTRPMPPSAVTAGVSPPTIFLPETRTRRGRHSPPPPTASDRWLRGLVVAGCVLFAVVLTMLAATLFNGGSAGGDTAPPVAGSSATAGEPTAEPSPEPQLSPTAAQGPRQRPTDIIAGIQVDLTQLVRDGQLKKDSAEELNDRLDDVSHALADGDTDEAWDKLRKVAEKLNKLREEDDLTNTGYQSLAAALTQLAQSLPPR